MTDDQAARGRVEELLNTMLGADGYAGIIRSWPAAGRGHAKIEIVAASAEACQDCLVSKSILAVVLADSLPAGIALDEADLTYPADLVV
jgi:hypothetical protein